MSSKLHQRVYSEVGADGRLDLASRCSQPTDKRLQTLIDHIKTHGYVIIEDAFSQADIVEAEIEIERLSAESMTGGKRLQGRNSFEGYKTQRIYALANKSRTFDKFPLHPDVLALNSFFLDPGYLLHSFQSITIQPGEMPQTLHHDDGYVTIPRPHAPFGTAIMVAIDSFTPTNGATTIVPKSHLGGADIPDRSEAVPAVMPKGSILYFLGTLWHGGGENTSSSVRRALTVQYCQPWMRPLENQFIAVEWQNLSLMPARLVDMLGYKVGAPFIGHVDGTSPLSVVSKLLKQRQETRAGVKEKAHKL